MARLARLSLAGLPHHVLQRGGHGQPIFRDDLDREHFLALAGQHARQAGVALHAYVLLDDHFHLLLTPTTAEALPRLMQGLGRDYVRHFNRRTARSGTLWEGRYRSTLVQPDTHLLDNMVYLDLHAVRRGGASEAREHAWSSHAHYAGLRADRWIVPPPVYWTLGNTPFAREAAYAERVRQGLSERQNQAITDAVRHGWALGEPVFLAQLQAETPRRVRRGRPGRPRSGEVGAE
jgi:putative transposase